MKLPPALPAWIWPWPVLLWRKQSFMMYSEDEARGCRRGVRPAGEVSYNQEARWT